MIVEGLESLPMVGRVETIVVPSGPYIMLLPFHNLSRSHASFALRVFRSAMDWNSEEGRVAVLEVRLSLRDAEPDIDFLCVGGVTGVWVTRVRSPLLSRLRSLVLDRRRSAVDCRMVSASE